jgi:quinol monooxygenase YgiN
MLTRTALYEGKVQPGREDEFFRRVREELEPIWRRFPHVRAVRVQRTVSADADARPIAMALEMDYDSQEALDASLASPIRTEAHAATEEVMKLFDGRFYHFVSEAG